MLIERIVLNHIKLELNHPFETSMGVETHEEHIIVRVDGEGLTGWGECVVEPLPSYSPETVTTAWHVLEDALIPHLLGRRFANAIEAANSWKWVRGHRMAKAGLETALWDMEAKALGISLSQLLGGIRPRVDVGVSIGMQDTPAMMLDQVEGFIEEGYQRVKIKIAPERDLTFIAAIRDRYPSIPFQVDANSAYTLQDLPRLKAMDDFDLLLIEQPLGHEDLFEHALIQAELNTPICLDESIHSLGDAQIALKMDSCRIINIKPGRVGGLAESKRIHDLCASQHIPVWMGGMLESGIGRASNLAVASLSNFTLPGDISASKRYFKQDIVEPEFVISTDGKMQVPTAPGIGVQILEERLSAVSVRSKAFSAKSQF